MQATHGKYPLRTWDEGFGEYYVYRETMGPVGVVRAQSWSDAWDATVDEIMNDADPDDPDTYATSYYDDAEEGELAEGVYYRSGVSSNPGLSSHLAQEDLNGSMLDGPYTAEQLKVRFDIHVSEVDT